MALFKVGSDICSIERIKAVYERHGERFLNRILTEAEKNYALSSKKDFLAKVAARFAAKEATAKVLGTGFIGVSWKEIEVVRKPSGAPTLKLSGRAAARASQLGLVGLELTMSHEREYAIAFVLGYGVQD